MSQVDEVVKEALANIRANLTKAGEQMAKVIDRIRFAASAALPEKAELGGIDDHLNLVSEIEEIIKDARAPDAGGHYRGREYKGIPFDPYRVALIFEVFHPAAYHIMKKVLRRDAKGHTDPEVVREIICSACRWAALIAEDEGPEAVLEIIDQLALGVDTLREMVRADAAQKTQAAQADG